MTQHCIIFLQWGFPRVGGILPESPVHYCNLAILCLTSVQLSRDETYFSAASKATVLIVIFYFGSVFYQKFSSASKYAALLMDGEQGDEGEDVE